jgi:hypothetical protein
MKFGPGKKTIKRLLVFFAQGPPKWSPPFTFGFQDVAIRHNCPTHFLLPNFYGGIIRVVAPKSSRASRILII